MAACDLSADNSSSVCRADRTVSLEEPTARSSGRLHPYLELLAHGDVVSDLAVVAQNLNLMLISN